MGMIGDFRRVTRHACVVAALAMMLVGNSGYAARAHYFDIDGTLVHDSGLNSEGKMPAWWGYWVLVRMSFMNNAWNMDSFAKLDEEGLLPREILVTRHEIDHLLRDKLATREERPGNPSPVYLLDDPIHEWAQSKFYSESRPRVIYPGYYMIVPSTTYKYHQDAQANDNNPLRTWIAAKARTKAAPDKFEWKGEAFRFFAKRVAQQSETERVFFLTDQNPLPSSMKEWLERMHAEGDLPSLPHIPKLISTTSVQGRNYGSVVEFESRKARAIEQQAMQLARSPLALHSTLSPDLDQANRGVRLDMHELIVYENRPEYIRPLLQIMKTAAARHPKIKFVLFHAGAADQVEGADFNYPGQQIAASRWLIFTPSGKGWRHPLAEEIKTLEGEEDDCNLTLKTSRLELPGENATNPF